MVLWLSKKRAIPTFLCYCLFAGKIIILLVWLPLIMIHVAGIFILHVIYLRWTKSSKCNCRWIYNTMDPVMIFIVGNNVICQVTNKSYHSILKKLMRLIPTINTQVLSLSDGYLNGMLGHNIRHKYLSLVLHIYSVRRCLGTQNPLQNDLQKGLEHKGIRNII